MTKQELFDKLAVHMLTQGRPALLPPDKDGHPSMPTRHGFDGAMSPIGLLIPKDKYRPEYDGASVCNCEYCVKYCGGWKLTLQRHMREAAQIEDDEQARMVGWFEDLQWDRPETWKSRIVDYAKEAKFNLLALASVGATEPQPA